jgi:hypothetical protein
MKSDRRWKGDEAMPKRGIILFALILWTAAAGSKRYFAGSAEVMLFVKEE